MRLFGTSFFIGDSIKGGTTADESLSGGRAGGKEEMVQHK